MRARIQPSGLDEVVLCEDARNIVVYDDFDNPILLVQKLKQGQIITYTPSSAGFDKAMRALGVGLNSTYKVGR